MCNPNQNNGCYTPPRIRSSCCSTCPSLLSSLNNTHHSDERTNDEDKEDLHYYQCVLTQVCIMYVLAPTTHNIILIIRWETAVINTSLVAYSSTTTILFLHKNNIYIFLLLNPFDIYYCLLGSVKLYSLMMRAVSV